MAKAKEVYVCSECGTQSMRWQGQCTGCGEWNTLEAVTVSKSHAAGKPAPVAGGQKPVALEDFPDENLQAFTTGVKELDNLLGSGFVPGGAVLVGGQPGIGKSTLLLQLFAQQVRSGRTAVYCSGEESLAQIKSRARRLQLLGIGKDGNGLQAISSTHVGDALAIIEEQSPDLLIVDSVQTLVSPNAEGIPGSVSQVRAVAQELVEATKKSNTTLILVGHVTKEGSIAGPKILEHMVDTVLYLEGDKQHFSRILRVLKNRYGPCDELCVFTMEQRGLVIVEDPATFFLGERSGGLSGTAIGMGLDGQRPFAVEMQALASQSFLSNPRRTALGLDSNRLHLMLAVLEKRLNIAAGQTDIYAKLGGGLTLRDPGMDLALAAAILSSFFDTPLPDGAVLWGEIDLNGQIRPVSGHSTRLKQAQRLGYKPILHPENCKTLMDMRNILFG